MTPAPNDSFVPFIATATASPDDHGKFLATVLSQPGDLQKFRTPDIAVSVLPTVPVRTATCEPKVTLLRDGDRVTGIQVQCSCGEVIELACTYTEPVTATAAPVMPPATIPPSAPLATAAEPEPGKICNEPGKEMPTSPKKTPKTAEKARGTSAAKRSSA